MDYLLLFNGYTGGSCLSPVRFCKDESLLTPISAWVLVGNMNTLLN